MKIDLICGDCLEKLKEVPDRSVDMVLTDPPYGCINCKWDKAVDMRAFFDECWRILTPAGALVTFADMKRAAQWIALSPKEFRYDIVWDKGRVCGFLNAKRCPLRVHELILVFARKQTVYNPQKKQGEPYVRKHGAEQQCYARCTAGQTICTDGKRYPKSIVYYPITRCRPHPTQKPLSLCADLVKTYTNPGSTVLDPFMGSGTTGVACVQTGRNFIGMELDEKYYEIAQKRISEAKSEQNSEQGRQAV